MNTTYIKPRALRPSGQWATDKGLADCVELDGFGIIGVIIDITGEGILLRAATTQPELLEAGE